MESEAVETDLVVEERSVQMSKRRRSSVWLGIETRIVTVIGFATAMSGMAFYHLGCACSRYLRFDRPWATAAASEIIVWLVFLVMEVNWAPTLH